MTGQPKSPYSSKDLRKLPFNEQAMIIAYDVNNGLRMPVKVGDCGTRFNIAFMTEKEKQAFIKYGLGVSLDMEEVEILVSYDPDVCNAQQVKTVLYCMALSND